MSKLLRKSRKVVVVTEGGRRRLATDPGCRGRCCGGCASCTGATTCCGPSGCGVKLPARVGLQRFRIVSGQGFIIYRNPGLPGGIDTYTFDASAAHIPAAWSGPGTRVPVGSQCDFIRNEADVAWQADGATYTNALQWNVLLNVAQPNTYSLVYQQQVRRPIIPGFQFRAARFRFDLLRPVIDPTCRAVLRHDSFHATNPLAVQPFTGSVLTSGSCAYGANVSAVSSGAVSRGADSWEWEWNVSAEVCWDTCSCGAGLIEDLIG